MNFFVSSCTIKEVLFIIPGFQKKSKPACMAAQAAERAERNEKGDCYMKVLVINAGSSSLKYQLIDTADGSVMAKGLCERIDRKSVV